MKSKDKFVFMEMIQT